MKELSKTEKRAEESTATTLLPPAEQGDHHAVGAVFSALYRELHRLAGRELARGGNARATLGVTTLLHEAYLNLGARTGVAFPDKARFMGYAARVMRGLIVDHARAGRAQKRGGLFEITTLEIDVADRSAQDQELARIGEALDGLAKVDAELAELVDLKFFCGFSFAEIAAMLAVSERTLRRRWEKARVYLYRTIRCETLDD